MRSLAQGRPELKRPEEAPQERPAETRKPKKGKEPRAVAVLELGGGGKGTLIPVAILIDGRFYDASVYKADPVPMALESGTVYEAEQAGDSQGLFTVIGALHSKNTASPTPWVGTGSYVPRGTEVASTSHKAEDVPVGMSNSDEPPRLTRGGGSKAAAASADSTAAPSGSGAAEKPGTAGSGPQSSPAPASSAGGASSDHDAPKAANAAASDKPASTKEQTAGAPTSSGQASASQAPPSQSTDQSQDYYRPTLRRGKPTQAAPREEAAAPKAVKVEGAGGSTAVNPEPVSGAPVQLVPAISDAGGPDPRSYKFFWKTGEEEERRNQMLSLAGDDVRAYARAQERNQIPAKPLTARPAAAGRKAAAKQEQPVFENLQFRTFDVWLNGQPVMILTAEAHFPPPPGAVAAAPKSYSVALVAKTDIYGNLRKLYSGVTDRFHLDVTPRLELIDAVDADGDGRGELLFRETSDAGSGYVIYRATADKLWKMFDNLKAE